MRQVEVGRPSYWGVEGGRGGRGGAVEGRREGGGRGVDGAEVGLGGQQGGVVQGGGHQEGAQALLGRVLQIKSYKSHCTQFLHIVTFSYISYFVFSYFLFSIYISDGCDAISFSGKFPASCRLFYTYIYVNWDRYYQRRIDRLCPNVAWFCKITIDLQSSERWLVYSFIHTALFWAICRLNANCFCICMVL